MLDEIVLSRARLTTRARSFWRGFRIACGGVDGLRGCFGGADADFGDDGSGDLEGIFAQTGSTGRWSSGCRSRIRRCGSGVTLMNAKLAVGGRGADGCVVDPRCRELIKDFEQVIYKEDSQVIDKDRDPKRTHLSDALGYLVWQECGGGGRWGKRGRGCFRRGTGPGTRGRMFDIDREHPDYVVRRSRSGGGIGTCMPAASSCEFHAQDYLVRRQREPGDVYAERLSRVFYENYIGSIVDWYAATLFRREPVLTFEGTNDAGEEFLRGAGGRCGPEGDGAERVFPAAVRGSAGCGSELCAGGFSAGRDRRRGRGRRKMRWGRRGRTWWIIRRRKSSTGTTTRRGISTGW